jgi:hypothetical protein
MICVRLEGGLGNQLFQYAAGRQLAYRHGTELILDTSTLQRYSRRTTPRKFELSRFSYSGRVATANESRFLPLISRVPKISHWLSPWRTFNEKGSSFNHPFQSLPDHTYLIGYWQSFKYFKDITKLLTSELKHVDRLSIASEKIAEHIYSTTSVSLHVRRGDYVSLTSAANFHGILPLLFYKKALARVYERINRPKFFVFSDDPEWCRYHLPLDDNVIFVSDNSGSDAWQDLVLMSYCQHHVIANSSFSWWGAWLADQVLNDSSRLVIAPARWFSENPISNQCQGDRFPSHWELIS